MREFIVGTVVAIVIAIAAGVIMNSLGMTTAQTYSTDDVRL